MATINVNVDENVKKQAKDTLDYLGTNFTNVINMLLRQIILTESIPFEIKIPKLNAETIKAIKDWFVNENIKLTAINNSPGQEEWSKSRKIYANLYIDDQFVGCPLQLNKEYSNRPFVDWFKIAVIFANIGLISQKRIVGLLDDLKAKYPKLYAKYEYNELKM